MYDSTAVRTKKRLISRNELTLQENIELSNGLQSRLTDIYINSKGKRQKY
jgi:hypothetical protein